MSVIHTTKKVDFREIEGTIEEMEQFGWEVAGITSHPVTLKDQHLSSVEHLIVFKKHTDDSLTHLDN